MDPRLPLRLTLTSWMTFQRRLRMRGGRGFIAGVMLSGYILVLFGLPLPAPLVPASVSAQPYPCQDGACGCRSSEQCWRSCCCYTDQQKLVWAEENNVTPPAEFLNRLTAEKLAETVPPPSSCCAAKPAGRVGPLDSRSTVQIGRTPAAETRSCVSAGARGTAQNSCETDDSGRAAESTIRFVITIEALKCRGVGTSWTGLSDVIPPPFLTFCQRSPLVGDAVHPACADLPEISFPPPSPPPRRWSPLV